MNKKSEIPIETEKDSTYFLKLVIYILAATLWIKFNTPLVLFGLPIYGFPLGLIIGLMFASHDHFQMDRKVEYAILLVMTVVTYFLPAGVVL